ncbi:UDP-xylose and UDP-N-acetylglucosamine transporter-like [Pieris napi]|uniref:UDP-xylose and UDP-N-acetylglucosamine transporter-like n=1 Tax=Pieris napi TaxID=78633 RepID=UPI001FB91E1A|nr:UDP-xylose and UDP-N-acetylglucosamine transporter-like [Pieris napi]
MVSLKSTFNLFFGCCLSAFLMEIMISKNPNCANLVTFLQFLCITLHGLLKIKHKVFTPKIPLGQYFVLISLFFVTSVANNFVYALHVASTLHMIIRSASSPASMLVAWFVKNRVPKVNAIIGSVIISSGVTIAMYGGAKIIEEETKFLHWCIGVVILLTTLITGAFTGLQQERLYATYGKFPEEMLFYTHAIPLPLFLIIMPELGAIALSLPSYLWYILVLNIIAQFYCANSVHILGTKESSVTVTFILTVRKFVSLIISSVVFKNSLTIYHVVGTVLVVIGTYFYFFVNKQQPLSSSKKK